MRRISQGYQPWWQGVRKARSGKPPRPTTKRHVFEPFQQRVITPGTLIDESFLNQQENNFLLAVSASQTPATPSALGLAWIDVSTGEFFSRATDLNSLSDQLARIGPREVVLHSALETGNLNPVRDALEEAGSFVTFLTPDAVVGAEDISGQVPRDVSLSQEVPPHDDVNVPLGPPESLYPALDAFTPEETHAINLLTTYMHRNLMEHMPTLSLPNREGLDSRLQIDSHTMKALELKERIHEGGVKGSLLSSIKHTVTTGGTRLLARWICSPSTSTAEITARQSLVTLFFKRPHFRFDLRGLLREVEDASRIVQRFLMGRGEPTDLLAIYTTIRTWDAILAKVREERASEVVARADKFDGLEWSSLDLLVSRLADLKELASKIGLAVVDNRLQDEAREDSEELEESVETSDTEISSVPLRLDGRVGNIRKFHIRPQ